MSDHSNILYKIKKYRSYLNANPNSHSLQSRLNKYTSKLNSLRGGAGPAPEVVLPEYTPTDNALGKPIKDIIGYNNTESRFKPNDPAYNPADYDALTVTPAARETFMKEYIKQNYRQFGLNAAPPDDTFFNNYKTNTPTGQLVMKLFEGIDESLVGRKSYEVFYAEVQRDAAVIRLRLIEILKRVKSLFNDYVAALAVKPFVSGSAAVDCEEKLRNLISVIREYISYRAQIKEKSYNVQQVLENDLKSIENRFRIWCNNNYTARTFWCCSSWW